VAAVLTRRRSEGEMERWNPSWGSMQAKVVPAPFYRTSEGAEQPGCEGEWWPSVGELKYMVMAQGGIGIEWAVPVLGVDRRTRCAAVMAKRAAEVQSSGGRRRLPGGPLWAARLRSQQG
jgi:hypothetical protein